MKARPFLIGSLLFLLTAAVLFWKKEVRSLPALPSPTAMPSLYALQKSCERSPQDAATFAALGTRFDQLNAAPLSYAAFARAASLAPDHEKIWIDFARMAAKVQSPRRAAAILAPFVQAHPADASAHLALAQWYQKLPIRRLAYDQAAAAARLAPAQPEAYREMTTAAIALQEYPKAETALRHLQTLDPGDKQSSLDLGFVLERLNRPAEALNCYRQAVRNAPSTAEPLRLAAKCLLKLSEEVASLQEAEQWLEQAVRLEPKDVLTHILLAQVAARRKDWRGAAVQIALAEQLPEATSEVQSQQTFLAAQVYQHLGQKKKMQYAQKRHMALLAYQNKKSSLFDKIVAHPTNSTARLEWARACAAHGDWAEAVAAYRRLASYAPGSTAGAEMKALLRRHSSYHSASPSPTTESAASPAPLPLSVLLTDAVCLTSEHQYDAAASAYLQALALDSQSPDALLGMGNCLRRQGKAEAAFAFLDQAFQQGARDIPIQRAVAAQFEANGFHNAARMRLERLVSEVPDQPSAWHLLGSVCSQSVEYSQEGREAYRKASALAPQNVGFLLDLADAEAEAGQTAQAEAEYRRAAALAPKNADALSRLAGFLAARQASVRSETEVNILIGRALACQPGNAFAWYLRGQTVLDRHQSQPAVSALRRSVTLAPTQAQSWYLLGRALQSSGDAREAAQAFSQSRQLRQTYFERTRLEEKVHLQPSDYSLRLRLARVYAAQGDAARSILEYRKCLALAPALLTLRRELAAYESHLYAQGRYPALLQFRYMLAQQQTG